jgi:GGDEF domain-containing protein
VNKFRFWVSSLLMWWLFIVIAGKFRSELAFEPHVFALMLAAVLLVVCRTLDVARTTLVIVAVLILETLISVRSTFENDGWMYLTECLAILVTAGLAQRVSHCVNEFEQASSQLMTARLTNNVHPFDKEQSELYRSVRRSRKYDRPLSVMTMQADPESVQHHLHQLIADAQRASINEYVLARIADVMSRTLSDCDVIARRGDCFIVVMPETDATAAEHVSRKLSDAIRGNMGISLKLGLSSFPDSELTLYGLLEEATERMRDGNHRGKVGRVPVSLRNVFSSENSRDTVLLEKP